MDDTTVPKPRKKFLPSVVPGLTAAQLAARKAARRAAIERFGKGRLPINPATGKRWQGTGKAPGSGIRSPVHPAQSDLPPVSFERWQSRRARAAALRERMQFFSAIYNAAWMVRDSQHGSADRRDLCIRRFVAVLIRELRDCRDPEALIFAVADSITASALGVPWEG